MLSNKFFEVFFQVSSVILVVFAGYSYLEGDMDRVFVSAVIGSLCFFIGIRFQVKERLQLRSEKGISELKSAETSFAADRKKKADTKRKSTNNLH